MKKLIFLVLFCICSFHSVATEKKSLVKNEKTDDYIYTVKRGTEIRKIDLRKIAFQIIDDRVASSEVKVFMDINPKNIEHRKIIENATIISETGIYEAILHGKIKKKCEMREGSDDDPPENECWYEYNYKIVGDKKVTNPKFVILRSVKVEDFKKITKSTSNKKAVDLLNNWVKPLWREDMPGANEFFKMEILKNSKVKIHFARSTLPENEPKEYSMMQFDISTCDVFVYDQFLTVECGKVVSFLSNREDLISVFTCGNDSCFRPKVSLKISNKEYFLYNFDVGASETADVIMMKKNGKWLFTDVIQIINN